MCPELCPKYYFYILYMTFSYKLSCNVVEITDHDLGGGCHFYMQKKNKKNSS